MSHISYSSKLYHKLIGIFILLFFFSYQAAEAAVIRAYTVRFSTNDSGDIALIGNKLSSCNVAVSGCTAALAGTGTGGALNNNTYDMVYVDIDSDGTTFNSSSANLTLPTGATVTWAGLYWGGDILNGTPNSNQMRFRAPGNSGYTLITSTQTDTTPSQVAGRTRYQGFANVTTQVKAAANGGNGTYFGANVQAAAGAGNKDSYAAWSLVVVYQDINQPLRNLTVFDGFAFVNGADPAVNIPISGFLTPLSGPVNTKVGMVIYEGDLGLTGDALKLNATTLSDALNPATNFFNSTISNLGIRTSSKNPDHVNQMAYDEDIINVSGILPNGANSATLSYSTNSDAYYPGMISFVTELHAPRLNIQKSVVDLNGGQVEPNDLLEYTITLNNSGLDSATNVILTDNIPTNTNYDPGSLVITAGANAGAKSDTPANDQAEFLAGPSRVVFRLGTGANGVSGGSIAPAASTTLRFRVRVTTPLANGTVITNQASVSYNAATSGQTFVTPSNPVSVIVASAPILRITKRDTLQVDLDFNTYPSPGDILRYTIQIQNSGNSNGTSLIFNDTPGAYTNLVVGSVTTSQGSVTTGNTGGDTTVSVNLGTVAGLGGSATIIFDVAIAAVVPAGVTQVSNQGILNSNELPPVVTDDPDTGVNSDPTITPITAAPFLTSNKNDTLFSDLDGNGVPSPGDILEYQITIRNHGNQNSTGIFFNDTPGVNTTLVVGSVTTSVGSVVTGNTGGDSNVVVNVGSLAGGGGFVTITFRVAIAAVLPSGVTQVANQGTISSNELPPFVTNDPDTASNNDPTITPVTAAPLLVANKTAVLLIDADSNGSPSPGDTLLYQINIRNNGNTSATNVTFQDMPDNNSTLVVGSVQTTQGSVILGNTAGDISVAVNLVTLPAQINATVSFQVFINTPLATGVTQLSNQGVVNSSELPTLPTNDPTTPQPNDPTITPITAAPQLVADKIDTHWIDADADGFPSPGDTILYQIIIRNIGNSSATGVNFADTPSANSTLITGTVQTTLGTVTLGNGLGDNQVAVNIGTIPGGSQLTIAFQVLINTPLPAGVTEIANQGTVSSNELPTVRTNDPDTPNGGDPTVTHISTTPKMSAYKTDILWDDVDGDGVPSAGDTLLYQISLNNIGNIALSNVTFTDVPDPNTTLILYTTQPNQGTVLVGNNLGDTSVAIDIGTIPAGSSVTIAFQVSINNPLPIGVTQIANQGLVNSNELPQFPTDDPDTQTTGDPTITPVSNSPILLADKTAILWNDADGSGGPSAGDTLLYDIQIQNLGHGAATAVFFDDTPDLNTTLITGTVQTSQGSVVTGNTLGDTTVSVNIGTIAGGSTINLQFHVMINTPLPGGVNQVANQGSISSTELPPVLTNDPTTGAGNDPTITPVTATPILIATKQDTLFNDQNSDGLLSPGDTILYTVLIYSSGQTEATAVTFSDTPGTYTSLVVGTVQTTQGVVTTGNTGGDTTIAVNIGTIPVGKLVQISFQVLVASPIPSGVTEISNQGLINSATLPPLDTNDPDTATADDPTNTPLNAAPDLFVTKTVNTPIVSPSGPISYTVSYGNIGSQDATGVVISDTVPAYTTYDAATSDPAWSCTGTAPGSICTATIGNLAVGATGQLIFGLIVDAVVPPNQLRNVAEINDDLANGPDLNYSNNTSSIDNAVAPPTAVSLHTFNVNQSNNDNNLPLFTTLLLTTITLLYISNRKRMSVEQRLK